MRCRKVNGPSETLALYLTSAFRDHDGRSRHAVRRLMLLQASHTDSG